MINIPFNEHYFLRPNQKAILSNPYNMKSWTAMKYLWILDQMNNIDSKSHCLDIGCGLGQGSWILSQRSESVVGVDISPFAIQFANSKYTGNSNSLKYLCSDFQKLSLNKTFDNIFCVHFLEHISKKEAGIFVKHLHKFCNSNSYIYINLPLENSCAVKYSYFMERLKGIPPHDPTHIGIYNVGEIKTLFYENGFVLSGLKRIFLPSKKLSKLMTLNIVPEFFKDELTFEALFIFQQCR